MELKEMAIEAWGANDPRTAEVADLVDLGEVALAEMLLASANPVQW